MKYFIRFLKEFWIGIVFFLFMNCVVTMCTYDTRKEYAENNKSHAINEYYLNKICAKSSCDNDMADGCKEYCYNKEVLGK